MVEIKIEIKNICIVLIYTTIVSGPFNWLLQEDPRHEDPVATALASANCWRKFATGCANFSIAIYLKLISLLILLMHLKVLYVSIILKCFTPIMGQNAVCQFCNVKMIEILILSQSCIQGVPNQIRPRQ